MNPSPTISFNYKGNNMDIADIRLLKREAEKEIVKIVKAFTEKTNMSVVGLDVDTYAIKQWETGDPAYTVSGARLRVRV